MVAMLKTLVLGVAAALLCGCGAEVAEGGGGSVEPDCVLIEMGGPLCDDGLLHYECAPGAAPQSSSGCFSEGQEFCCDPSSVPVCDCSDEGSAPEGSAWACGSDGTCELVSCDDAPLFAGC